MANQNTFATMDDITAVKAMISSGGGNTGGGGSNNDSTLSAQVQSNTATINQFKQWSSGINSSISSINSDIAKLKNGSSNTGGNTGGGSNSDSGLSTQVQSNTSSISQLKTWKSSVDSDISTMKSDIAALKSNSGGGGSNTPSSVATVTKTLSSSAGDVVLTRVGTIVNLSGSVSFQGNTIYNLVINNLDGFKPVQASVLTVYDGTATPTIGKNASGGNVFYIPGGMKSGKTFVLSANWTTSDAMPT